MPNSKGCLCHLEMVCLGAMLEDSQASAYKRVLNLCPELKTGSCEVPDSTLVSTSYDAPHLSSSTSQKQHPRGLSFLPPHSVSCYPIPRVELLCSGIFESWSLVEGNGANGAHPWKRLMFSCGGLVPIKWLSLRR